MPVSKQFTPLIVSRDSEIGRNRASAASSMEPRLEVVPGSRKYIVASGEITIHDHASVNNTNHRAINSKTWRARKGLGVTLEPLCQHLGR